MSQRRSDECKSDNILVDITRRRIFGLSHLQMHHCTRVALHRRPPLAARVGSCSAKSSGRAGRSET
jgi:hypothetical protein